MWLVSWSAPTVRVMERCQTHNRTPVILANAHCVKARGFFWSACDCPAYQTHVILWSKDGQTTAKNKPKRASLYQIDWNVATEGAQPARAYGNHRSGITRSRYYALRRFS